MSGCHSHRHRSPKTQEISHLWTTSLLVRNWSNPSEFRGADSSTGLSGFVNAESRLGPADGLVSKPPSRELIAHILCARCVVSFLQSGNILSTSVASTIMCSMTLVNPAFSRLFTCSAFVSVQKTPCFKYRHLGCSAHVAPAGI